MSALWIAIRVTGLVSYAALTLGMMFGVMLSGRGLHVPTLHELHRSWTMVALGFGVLHGALLAVTEAKLLLDGEIAVGGLALMIVGGLVAATTLRQYIGVAAWRALHTLAFAAWVLAAGHMVWAGSDLQQPVTFTLAYGSIAAFLGAFLLRVGAAVWARKVASA